MDKLLNPYIAGAPVVEPSMFFGREDVFNWIEQNLTGRFVNHILVIHGQRRVGKTSVIKQLPNRLPPHFIHIFFDLQGRTHTSIDRFQWWLAREICRAIHQARGLSIPTPERELFSQDTEYLVSIFLPQVLSQIEQSILLLTFDEFDTLTETEIQDSLTRPLIAYLRRLFDLPKLNFIFSIGSSGHKLENMQASYTEFFKAALYRKISFLKQEDCARLISQPVEGVLQYDAAAVERIYAITSGHPYFTQLICHELFSLCQKTGNRVITKQDVDSVLEDVIERGTVNLKFVWDEATDLEKWVLASLAHKLQAQETAIRSQGIQRHAACTHDQLATALRSQHVRYSENDLNGALVHLREKDVITQENQFVIELMCIWLLKNRPLDRVREELVQVNPIANRYNEIGEEFHALGQPEKALESFRQALATDPLNLRAQLSIANLQLEANNYTQAVQGYEQALRIDEDDIAARSGLCAALMALGEAATSSGQPVEACEYYERVVSVNPAHPEVHQRLARLYTDQAEAAIQAEDAESALKNFAKAVEHAPEDQQLAERYAQVQEEHTKQLVAGLLEKYQQASEEKAWEVALDAIQRALQLAPNEPTLLKYLEVVKDAPRLAKIADLCRQARELEQHERWDEAVQSWEACLQLQPSDEVDIQASLEYARGRQKLAAEYTQAQVAIKSGQYNQAIRLLQGIITMDASYKDAAQLLVDCLKVHPRRQLNLPAGWWRWAVLGFVVIAIIAGVATQWSRLSGIYLRLLQQKTPVSTQLTDLVPTNINVGTYTQPTIPPFPTSTPDVALQEVETFTMALEKLTSGRAPDYQDDFSPATLNDYWKYDAGANMATLTESALRLNNEKLIGDGCLQMMNYILQVDLRFDQLAGNEWFDYAFRLTQSIYGNYGTEYMLSINPSSGRYIIRGNTDPHTDYSQLAEGVLGVVNPGQWYTLGVVVNGSELWTYWDGSLLKYVGGLDLFGLINHFGLEQTYAGNATLDIDNWRVWDLGIPEWMTSDSITSQTATLSEDNFTQDADWQFHPVENGSFENNRVVLTALNSDTDLTRNELNAYDFALEVDFIPRSISENSSLSFFLVKNTSTGDMLVFEYFLQSGTWQIERVYDQGNQWQTLYSGWVDRISLGDDGVILVDLNQDTLTVYINGEYKGAYGVDRTGHGSMNAVVLRNNDSLDRAQVDIPKIQFWDRSPFTQKKQEMIGDQPPDIQEDFSGDTLSEIWQWGGEDNTLQDGALRVEDWVGEPLHAMNYILQVDLRFNGLSGSENLVYAFRCTGLPMGSGLEYTLSIFLSTGEWTLSAITDPQSQGTPLQQGFIEPIQQGRWYELGVVLNHQNLWVFWEGIELFSLENLALYGLDNHFGLADNVTGEATLEIDNWRFWELGIGIESRNNWISESEPTILVDNFSVGQGWQFDPGEYERYEDGKVVLYTDKDETKLSRDDFQGVNVALEVTFIPRDVPESSSLVWFFAADLVKGNMYTFDYFPASGYWAIMKSQDQVFDKLIDGWTEPTLDNETATIMVFIDNNLLNAFMGDTLLGTVQSDLQEAGTQCLLSVRNKATQFVRVDIEKIQFWDLDTVKWESMDWLTSEGHLFTRESFSPGEGWTFAPLENEKFENGIAVLFTNGGEVGLTRNDMQASRSTIDFVFTPRNMPESASLVWVMVADLDHGHKLEFEYIPSTGFWQIVQMKSMQRQVLMKGTTQSTSQDQSARIMVSTDGYQVSAFFNNDFLGTAHSGLTRIGTWNELIIRNPENTFALVDISRISFWNWDK
jgi:tetratricopeptide (TPR) repeat protein